MPRRRHDWRAEARSLVEAVPYGPAQRIRRRVRARALGTRGRRRWHGAMMLAFAAGAALVLLVVYRSGPRRSHQIEDEVATARAVSSSPSVEMRSRPPDPSPPGDSNDRAGAVAIEGSDCAAAAMDLRAAGGLVLKAGCRIVASGLRVDGEIASRVRGDAARIHLYDGRLRVAVEHRDDRDEPFIVDTPALRIEVVGTRFTVAHGATGGSLSMHEGRVRVVGLDGETREVGAPGSLSWYAEGARWVLGEPPSASSSTPGPGATGSSRRRRKEVGAAATRALDDRAEQLVREVARLRARGDTAEAVRVIEGALPRLRRRDREALSFELGQLLQQTRGVDAACQHWSTHAQRFPGGRYADLVADEGRRLRCSTRPPPSAD